MKQRVAFIAAIAAAFGAGITIPVLMGSSKADRHHTADSEVIYCVTPPSIPTQAVFAGETVDLQRYDKRERMDREMMSFTYMHSSTMLMIKRANRYFPIVEPILKTYGVPDDFKYLMSIESSLNTLARSAVGAAGLWQFMPATAKEYGLQVNDNVDERYHIEKATAAACRYLLKAYDKYGNWLTVAASYNAGQGRISKELEQQMQNNAADLWLVEETSRYMFRLLAIKEIFNEPSRFGFILSHDELYPPILYNEVEVTSSVDNLAEFATRQGISYAQLKDLNPWLRDRSLKVGSGSSYKLKIPTKESMFYNPAHTRPHNPNWVVE